MGFPRSLDTIRNQERKFAVDFCFRRFQLGGLANGIFISLSPVSSSKNFLWCEIAVRPHNYVAVPVGLTFLI